MDETRLLSRQKLMLDYTCYRQINSQLVKCAILKYSDKNKVSHYVRNHRADPELGKRHARGWFVLSSPRGKRGNSAKNQGCFPLSLLLFSFPQQRKVNTPTVQPFSITGYPAPLAPSTNVRSAWVDKRGPAAGSTGFLLERHLKEFYDLLRQLSLHLAQQCLSQFGRWHRQVPALLTHAGSDRCCPSTGLT